MLILFGLSWPFNISKSWRSRTAKGKSIHFEIVIQIAYCFGLAGKFIKYSQTGTLDMATTFYIIDICMVAVDMILYFRNVKLDKEREALESDIEYVRKYDKKELDAELKEEEKLFTKRGI